ncbi:MAG: hypothetical protein M3Y41_12950 [Pseudomonadota bacterium]|nr:hypothetical protein [Pseudomonadota bacterium]
MARRTPVQRAAEAADTLTAWLDGYLDTSTPAAGDKPVLVDTDHVYGIGGSAGWVWEQFTDGNSVLSMDSLDGTGIRRHAARRRP